MSEEEEEAVERCKKCGNLIDCDACQNTQDVNNDIKYMSKKVKDLEKWQTSVGAAAGLNDPYFKAPEQILQAVAQNTYNVSVMKADHVNLALFREEAKKRTPGDSMEDLLGALFGPNWRTT